MESRYRNYRGEHFVFYLLKRVFHRLVIRANRKKIYFQHVFGKSRYLVNRKQFSIESAVPCLGGQGFRKKNATGCILLALFVDCLSHRSIRRISKHEKHKFGIRISQYYLLR